ncbi:MAG: type IIS restriction enzyme [uncultured Sulfurovum sp.]|uniref:Type IIS restriction enzyme n=1 Tax=uncultured Sulfurovum sp. TaxID=269237 RepID=A0A6S6U205_9BACT|nr:MAG: type IIS restriction enzyme [uncultured Sulfurovum sp.]
MGDLFEIKSNRQLNKDSFVFNGKGEYPYFTRTVFNNGIFGYVDYLDDEHKIKGNCLAVGMMGMQFFYMQKDFYAGQFTKRAIPKLFSLTPRLAIYFISLLNKNQDVFKNVLVRNFENEFNKFKIQLPIKNNKIDFEFMESFIAQIEAERIEKLEAYLEASGLKDYILTAEEEQVLEDFENGKIEWDEFIYKNIFNKIIQGRRLTKDNQISGTIPFVMAGTTNTGIVNHISNPVASFPKNSITIDIFGNTFYRDYDFGAGDDTGVYWNTKKEYSRETMLFFTTSMGKSILGKFNYGTKLRSSKSLDLKMKLPTKNQKPNYESMQTLMSAVQKLVIKDVVLYVDNKIEV